MLENKHFFSRLVSIEESSAESRNRKVELTKDQEFNLSKQSKLPVTMRVGPFKVQASIHAQARAHQRAGDKSAEEWKEFARKIVKHTETNKIKGGTYMFHSQSENRSVVASVKGREINIVTVFPKGTGGKISHKQLAAGQKSAMMESLLESLMIHPDFKGMIDEAKQLLDHDVDSVIIFDIEEKLMEEVMINENMSGTIEYVDTPVGERETRSIAQFAQLVTKDNKSFSLMIPDRHDTSYFGDGVARVDMSGGGRFGGQKTFVVKLDLKKGTVAFPDNDSDDDKDFEKPVKFKKVIVFDKVAAKRF